MTWQNALQLHGFFCIYNRRVILSSFLGKGGVMKTCNMFLSVTLENLSLYISSCVAYQVEGGFYFFRKYYTFGFCPSKRKIS